MRRHLGALAGLVAIALTAGAAVSVTGSAQVNFEADDVVTVAVRSFDRLSIVGCRTLSRVGEPELPARVLHFVIPGDARVVDVVADYVEVPLPGTHRILPAQPEAPIGETPEWADPNPAIYGRDDAYPSERVVYLGDGYLGGYRIASVAVYPLQYAPKSGRLTLATDVTIELELASGANRSLPRHRMTSRSADLYRRLVSGLVENPEDLMRVPSSEVEVVEELGPEGFSPRYSPSLEGSPVEYVIITNDQFYSYFEDLADWKTQKGVPAVVKTVSWINANYPGGCDEAERIRNFIRDAYSSWGTTYVLLGGDTNIVPARYAQTTYYGGGYIPTDLYYSDLDGNWNADGDSDFGEGYRGEDDPGDSVDLYPDVYVGRASVRNVVQLAAFLDKVEAYEKTPVDHFTDRNLYLAEVLFPYDWDGGAYSLDGASDISEPSLSYVPPWITNVRMYQNTNEFPDAHPLNAPAMGDSLDRGYNIVIHIGHGNKDILRAGTNSYMSMSQASDLSNGVNKASFMWMLNCTTAAIDHDCIAERFTNNPEGGAVGLFGPTRYAFPATSRSYYWDWLDLLYNLDITQMGVTCAASKAMHASFGESGADNTDRWTQLCTLLLGDPELSLWTDRPKELAVDHPSSIEVGAGGMVVTVTNPSPVDSALVCALKDGDVYTRGRTDASGQVTLNFVPHKTGTLTITVSAPNHIPHESSVNVVSAAGAHVYLKSSTLDDDTAGGSDGNSNGLTEAGETVELDITAENSGVTTASGVTATLTSSDAYVIIEDGTEYLGNISPSSSEFAEAAFRFSATVDAPNEHDAELTIEFTDSSREIWTEDIEIRLFAPVLHQIRVELDDSSGNGNGVPETGETVVVSMEVLNEGNGDAGTVMGRLRYPFSAVTVQDSTYFWGDVPAGETVGSTGEFSFTVNGSINNHFRLLLTDGRGGTWSSYIDFLRPAGVDSIYGQVEGTTINLLWDPATDADLRGYDIYRSQNLGGPYELVNDAVVEGSAYYSDPGLEDMTLYHYYVVAVDSSGNYSSGSAVLSVSTNPPSLSGWPLETQSAIYSSPVCADVDGDDDLEIVVGAEHIYVWHEDGTELIDGDGDPRTGGIFEVDGSGGYRASPAVGEIDGDAGVEIVAPAWSNVGSEIDPAYEVFVWNAEDGSVVPGWPVTTKKFCWASPGLADLDGDGRCEIIQTSADGNVYCWRYNGSEFIDGDDDPLTLGVFADLPAMWDYASPAIADLDGDRVPEIIQPSTAESIFVYHSDGSRMDGWPFWVESNSFTSPAVGDVDKDGKLEVAVGSNADKVWLLERDGTVMSGWPRSVVQSEDFSPSPTLADITGDGYLEVVLVGRDGVITVKDYLGNDLPGWPLFLGSMTLSSPTVADIDGDPGLEIVVGDKNGKLHCFDDSGASLDGWPIQTENDLNGTACIVDLDEDGDVEVIVGGMDTRVYVWDCTGIFDEGEGVEWGCFLHDAWRTQLYDFVVPTDVDTDEPQWNVGGRLVLEQNTPNPFNPVTTISFAVPQSEAAEEPVRLVVYDVAGRSIRTLVDERLAAGRYGAVWDGKDERGLEVSSGVYFYRIDVGEASASRKMILLK